MNDSKQRILFVICGDKEDFQRNSDLFDKINDIINSQGSFMPISRSYCTFDTMKKTVQEKYPVIIHFLGHGLEEGIMFADEFVLLGEFTEFFKNIQNKPKLIIFFSCSSSKLCQKIFQETGIPCIGSDLEVNNLSNEAFIEPFYLEIFNGNAFSKAITVANTYIGKDQDGNAVFELYGEDGNVKDDSSFANPEIQEFAKSFISDRLERIRKKDTGILDSQYSHFFTIHTIPQNAESTYIQFKTEDSRLRSLWPIAESGCNPDLFEEGYVKIDSALGKSRSYALIFSNGCAEAVNGLVFQNPSWGIGLAFIQRVLFGFIKSVIEVYKNLDISPPIAISVNFIEIRDYPLFIYDSAYQVYQRKYLKDEYNSKIVTLTGFDQDLREELKPLFVPLCNAGGYGEEYVYKSFDENNLQV